MWLSDVYTGIIHSGPLAQFKEEMIELAPRTTDGFRATVNIQRFLDGSKEVSFHTLSLPEDRYVRQLIKNLGRQMKEDVVREELETLGIYV